MMHPIFRFLFIWLSLSAIWFGQSASAREAAGFDSGLLSFSVRVHEIVNQYSTFFVPVQPFEKISLRIEEGGGQATFHLEVPEGELKAGKRNAWSWRAPKQPGLYPVTIRREGTGELMTLNLFVQVPAEKLKKGILNGYRIGHYPKPREREALDLPPKGFIEVTRQNENTRISPHFVLKQFLCKQEGGYPKYLVLNPKLLAKLEVLLTDVNAQGIRTDSFHVMSGYRTPYYNAAIDNVRYSRHVWGSAADIFIDVDPRDGDMDDLNGDGVANRADATHLYRIADTFDERHSRLNLEGGVGEYGSTKAHGPFVHVDVRGKRARWGHTPLASSGQ